MAEPNNPLIPVQNRVIKIETKLVAFLRTLLSNVKPMTTMLTTFLANVKKAATDLAKTVGKAAVDSILKAGKSILQVVSFVEKSTIEGLKLARNILNVIKKAAQPEKVFNVVKKMMARFAKIFRTIVTKVSEIMVILAPIETVLSVIGAFRTVLQLIFKWISQVAGLSGVVKKARGLLKKSYKMLKEEAKEVTKIVKEVNKLKPA